MPHSPFLCQLGMRLYDLVWKEGMARDDAQVLHSMIGELVGVGPNAEWAAGFDGGAVLTAVPGGLALGHVLASPRLPVR